MKTTDFSDIWRDLPYNLRMQVISRMTLSFFTQPHGKPWELI